MAAPIPSHHPLRIFAALTLFLGVTSAGVFLMTRFTPDPPRPKVARDERPKSGPKDDRFFYKTLGKESETAQTKSPEPASNIPLPSGYTVEFGAFTEQEEAEKELDRLRAQGIEAYYTPLSDGGQVVYRVRKGLFHDQSFAESEAQKVAKALGRSPQVKKLE